MTPAVAKLIEAVRLHQRQFCGAKLAIPTALDAAIAAVGVESAATGDRPNYRWAKLLDDDAQNHSVFLCSDADPMFADLESEVAASSKLLDRATDRINDLESKLQQVRARIAEGMPPLSQLAKEKCQEMDYSSAVNERTQQYQSLLSRLGEIVEGE